MALNRFPAATCRNPHFLMVIAGRATRGKSITEPKAFSLRDTIGDIGKCRRALVGSNNQIRVITIMAKDISRWNEPGPVEIVGEVEQV